MIVDTFFSRLVAAIEQVGVPYMITGSFASSAHGVVRGTQDIDVIIAPTAEQLQGLVAQFPDDRYYADAFDALDALQHRSQFNIIDFASTWKADLIIRKERPFSRVEFDRRRRHVIAGINVFVATPEDVVLAKLEWAKMGESDRQIEDAAGVIATQGQQLDRVYVERWVRELGLELQWQRALRAAS